MPVPLNNSLLTLAPWVMLVAGMMLAAGIDPYINRRDRRIIEIINVLVLLLMAAEMTEYIISKSDPNDLLRTCACAFGYTVRPVLLVLFLEVLFPRKYNWMLWIVAGINAAVYTVSIFTGVAFFIVNNGFHRGPLNRVCLIVSILLIMDLTAQLFRVSRRNRKREIYLILFADAMIVLGILADAVMSDLHVINFLTMSIIGCTIFYYQWMHLQLSRLHEEKTVEHLQTEHRVQLMMSQIQPHFLYNTLSSIQALCATDSTRAAELTERLGMYLRENLDSIGQPNLVPFEKEIEHTRIYTQIEQVRFPSISILYDLQDTDFNVPALTIQPMVENAIRHGVRIRTNGIIHIVSRCEGNDHQVIIQDNGKGFDADQAFALEGQHIGLRNVRERVEQMCGGTLEIISTLGEGTTVTLRFPAGKEQA